MLRRADLQTPGIGLFALFVFVLVTAPKLNVKLGPLPLYMVDFLIGTLLLMSHKLPPLPRGQRRFSGTVLTILVLALAGELAGIIVTGQFMDPLYIGVRTVLAFSVFYLAGQYVRTVRDVELVLRAFAAGLVITASLMILTSLPMTRNIMSDLVFSHSFLEPAAEDLGEYIAVASETGSRGRTLIGVSILGASFINACWPLAALLFRWPWPAGLWRLIALVACLLAPMGVLMSYSRGPILGSVLILLAAVIFGLTHVRRGILVPVTVGVITIMTIGVGSQLFFFDRLTNRVDAMFDAPFEDERESERTLAYIEPFAHAMNHPRFLVLGEGITARRGGFPSEQAGKATHAVFAVSYYAYGMIAAVLYLSLIARALFFLCRRAISRRNTMSKLMAQPLFLAVVGLVPWAAFGHAAVSAPRGAMLFFLIFGLITPLCQTRPATSQARPRIYNAPAHRRHTALG